MLLHIILPEIDTNSIKSDLPPESRFYVNETGSAGGTQKALGIATYSYQAYEAGGFPPFLSGAYQNELSIIQGESPDHPLVMECLLLTHSKICE